MALVTSWTDQRTPLTTRTLVYTVPVAIAVGRTIFAQVTAGTASAGVVTTTDSRGNTWTTSNTQEVTGLGRGALLRCRVTTAFQVGDTITVTVPANTTRWAAVFGVFDDVLTPYQGINATPAFDNATSITVGPTAVDVQPFTLVVMGVTSTGAGLPYAPQGGLFTVGSIATQVGSDRAAGLFYRYGAFPTDQYSGTVRTNGSVNVLGLLTGASAVEPPPPEPSDLPMTVWNGTAEVPVLTATIWNGTTEVPVLTGEVAPLTAVGPSPRPSKG